MRIEVKNPLSSVYPATANPGENIQQPIPTAPHVISMRSVESAAISQMEISMATTAGMEQMTATTVNHTGLMTAVDQMATMIVVDQPTSNTAAMLAADQIATMPTVDQTATIAVDQMSVSTFDNLTTTSAALVNAPATVAPVEAPATEAPVDAPATVTVPSVGLGTGKKAGTMQLNPHSTTAR
jgi:hypothetical protein